MWDCLFFNFCIFCAKAPLVSVGIRTLQYWTQNEKCQYFKICSTFFCCILCKFLPSAPSLTLSDLFYTFFVLFHWWFSFSWNTNIVSCEVTVACVCIAFLLVCFEPGGLQQLKFIDVFKISQKFMKRGS